MKKTIIALLLAIALTGCAGAMGGGHTYKVDYTLKDGTEVHARVDSIESVESMDFKLTRDENGQPLVSFSKNNARPGEWQNGTLDKALDVANAAMKRIPVALP